MIGAIAGDIIGSIYEGSRIKTKDFPLFDPGSRFTDDTVLTVAVAQAVLTGGDYASSLKNIGKRYPHCGYGGAFSQWLFSGKSGLYNSWGNGFAMRVSPISLGGDTMACITGAIAEAYYGGVSKEITRAVRTILPDDLWNIAEAFCRKYYDTSFWELSSST